MRTIYKTRTNKYVKLVGKLRDFVLLSPERNSYKEALNTTNIYSKKVNSDVFSRTYKIALNNDKTITYTSVEKRKQAQEEADRKMKYYYSTDHKKPSKSFPTVTSKLKVSSFLDKIKSGLKSLIN